MTKKLHIQAKINGKQTDFLCEPRQSLLEVLRDVLQLTGAKEGCNNGNCGACNVLLDGRLRTSCIVMVPEAQEPLAVTLKGVAGGQGCTRLRQKSLETAALRP